jgi:hypothetical protein
MPSRGPTRVRVGCDARPARRAAQKQIAFSGISGEKHTHRVSRASNEDVYGRYTTFKTPSARKIILLRRIFPIAILDALWYQIYTMQDRAWKLSLSGVFSFQHPQPTT